MEIINKYFPDLSQNQINQFSLLFDLYNFWNSKINVISRKDIENLYQNHILHSLSIAKFINFHDDSTVIDVGTGGGFPGIPLAIFFPNCKFHLIDSIGKKVKVVEEVSKSLMLENLTYEKNRIQENNSKFDFVVSRAVTNFTDFVSITKKNIKKEHKNIIDNGIIYLKGGDLSEELSGFKNFKIIRISDYFNEDFFETKKIVYYKV